MAQHKTSKSNEGYFAKYKASNRAAANRKLKLERQIKLQPGNAEQLQVALKSVGYRRGTPKAPFWTPSMIATAMLMKSFTGKLDKNLFSPNPDAQTAAAKARNVNKFERPGKGGTRVPTYPQPSKGSMFSLAARAHWGGVLVWK